MENAPHPEVKTRGLGIVPELLSGPVPAEKRKFQDLYCTLLYGVMVLLLIILLAVSGAKANQDASPGTRVLVEDAADADGNVFVEGASMSSIVEHYFDDLLEWHTPDHRRAMSVRQYKINVGAPIGVLFFVVFFASAISYLFLMLTPSCAGVIIWVMIVIIALALLILSIVYFSLKIIVLGVILLLALLIFLVVVHFLRKKIARAITMIKIACLFFIDHPNSVFISAATFLLYLVVTLMYIACLFLAFEARVKKNISQNLYGFVQFINVVMVYWQSCLCACLANLGIAIYFSQWYFSHSRGGRKRDLENPLRKSLLWPLRYHFGSVAMGGFLMAVVQMTDAVVDYQSSNTLNPVTRVIRCIVACIRQWVESITSSVMSMIALTGDSFCDAASDSFQIIVSKFTTFLALQQLSAMYTAFGRWVSALISAGVGFGILWGVWRVSDLNKYNSEYGAQIIAMVILFTIVYVVVGLVISHFFMTVLQASAQACLFNVAVDKTLCDGQILHGPDQVLELVELQKENAMSAQNKVQNFSGDATDNSTQKKGYQQQNTTVDQNLTQQNYYPDDGINAVINDPL